MERPKSKLRAFQLMEQVDGVDEVLAKGKLTRLIDYLKELHKQDFTGYVKINFTQGNIGRVEKFEEILKR